MRHATRWRCCWTATRPRSSGRRRTRRSTWPCAPPDRSCTRTSGTGGAACSSSTRRPGRCSRWPRRRDWRRALEVLAAAEPDARIPAFALLRAEGGIAARALELVVVTSRLDAALVDRLVQRVLSRRGVSLVYVEPASFAGRSGEREPQL